MFVQQFKVVWTWHLSYTNLLESNLKLYSLMIEVFDRHLILYYKTVTCQKQGLNQNLESQHLLEWSHFTFSKWFWSEIKWFKTQGEVFLCKNKLFILFICLLVFDQIIYSQEVTMVLFIASPKNLNLLGQLLLSLA